MRTREKRLWVRNGARVTGLERAVEGARHSSDIMLGRDVVGEIRKPKWNDGYAVCGFRIVLHGRQNIRLVRVFQTDEEARAYIAANAAWFMRRIAMLRAEADDPAAVAAH